MACLAFSYLSYLVWSLSYLTESDQGLLPHAEEGFSPNTAETLTKHAPSDIPQPLTSHFLHLTPNLPSKNYSSPDFLLSPSDLLNLSEMESGIHRSQTQVFDERDVQRALSPISLKSDFSLAGCATDAGTPEVRALSGESSLYGVVQYSNGCLAKLSAQRFKSPTRQMLGALYSTCNPSKFSYKINTLICIVGRSDSDWELASGPSHNKAKKMKYSSTRELLLNKFQCPVHSTCLLLICCLLPSLYL